VRLHYIAEKVFGTATDIGGWVVIGDELSRQDESGTLSLVDPQSGAVLEQLTMPPGTIVSGLESDGHDLFFCGGGTSGKVRAVRRRKRA